jgi:hypothetical protein
VPLPATKQHGKRVDYEYERIGHGEHLHVLRTALRLSTGDRPRASHQDRLGD